MDEDDYEEWLDSEEDAWFHEVFIEALRDLDVELDPDQAEELGYNVTQGAIEDLSEEVYKTYLEDDDRFESYKEARSGFTDRLRERWGDALDLLDRFIFESFQLGSFVNHTDRPEASEQNDTVFEALTRLHARACQIALEILTLLQAGYADGAFARWRSLHETAISAAVIRKHGPETAERFLLHRHVTDEHFAETYHKFHRELGYEPFSTDTLRNLNETVRDLRQRFGDRYADNPGTGWAENLVPGKPSIKKLEKEADLEHLRPFYSFASDTVHGGSKGTMERLGILNLDEAPDRPEVLPGGPSNAGLELPARLAATSLHQVTAALVAHRPTISRLIELSAQHRLLDDIEQSFVREAENLKEDHIQALEEWKAMGITDIALSYLGLDKLLTDKFLQDYSDFESLEDFKEASPVDLPSEGAIDDETKETLDSFISESTEFSSFDDMIEEAFGVWVGENVDLDDFSDS